MGVDQRTYIPAKAKRAKARNIIVSRPGNKINSIFTPRGRTPLHLNKITKADATSGILTSLRTNNGERQIQFGTLLNLKSLKIFREHGKHNVIMRMNKTFQQH